MYGKNGREERVIWNYVIILDIFIWGRVGGSGILFREL